MQINGALRVSLLPVLLLCLLLTACNSPQKKPEVTLIVTTNLNGALDDCQCSPVLVGGLTRISTVSRQLQEQHQNALLISGGDFLSSYPRGAENLLMFELMKQLPFDIMAVGDQEFVEGSQQLARWLREDSKNILLPANLQGMGIEEANSETISILSTGQTTVAVVNLIDPEAFDFIRPPGIHCQKIDDALADNADQLRRHDLQILLLHAGWEKAREIATKFSWIDVIILSHNQYRGFEQVGETALFETGVDGEYVGRLTISPQDTEDTFEYQYVPVTLEVPADETLLAPVLQLMDSLGNVGQTTP